MHEGGTGADGAFVSRAPRLGFAPGLDGLRAISLVMVLLVHAAYEVFGSFGAGVDVFFVVSGFLITTLLFEERRSSGRIDLRQFYLRRALRLFPALYVTLAGTLAGALIVGDRQLRSEAWNDVWSAFLYVYHVVHPVHQELVGGGAPEIRPLVHLWSLSVEEHFYVVAAAAAALVLARRWVTRLGVVLAVAWLAVGLARLSGHVGPRFMWFQRPDSLLAGVVAAIVHAHLPAELGPRATTLLRRAAAVAAVVGVAVVWTGTKFAKPLGLYVPFVPPEGRDLHDGLFWGEYGYSVVAACAAVLAVATVRLPSTALSKFLAWRPLQAVGRRSYVLYLLHLPVFVLLFEAFGEGSPGLLLYLPLYPLLSEAVHRFVERPAMRLRHRFQAPGASGV